MRKLKIAQLVLPWIALPPAGYAGTERVVYHLTEELVRRGHQVTLFASGDSQTSARLESVLPKALGLQADVKAAQAGSFYPLLHVAHCFEMAHEFDIIHSHAQFLGLPLAAASTTKSVHTFHRVYEFKTDDEKDLVMHFGEKLRFTSISNAQRVPGINYVSTVYNGIDTTVYKPLSDGVLSSAFPQEHPQGDPFLGAPLRSPPLVSPNIPTRDYLFWAGRVIDKKGPEDAIVVAKALGIPLVMAGEVTEPGYFEKNIKPHIDGVKIQLVQHITREAMVAYYQNAKVAIIPTKWNEPFGLVPVEAMSCGTPVVSYALGGVAETIANGTGFLVPPDAGTDGLIAKTKEILDMDESSYRSMCAKARQHILDHFSVEKMTTGYEEVYEKVLDGVES